MDDTLDALDLDRLQQTIQVLKDGGVVAFRFRDLEIGFEAPTEEAKTAGFVPKEKQAATLAAHAEAEDGQAGGTAYHRAFGGKLPTFTRATPPKQDE